MPSPPTDQVMTSNCPCLPSPHCSAPFRAIAQVASVHPAAAPVHMWMLLGEHGDGCGGCGAVQACAGVAGCVDMAEETGVRAWRGAGDAQGSGQKRVDCCF